MKLKNWKFKSNSSLKSCAFSISLQKSCALSDIEFANIKAKNLHISLEVLFLFMKLSKINCKFVAIKLCL